MSIGHMCQPNGTFILQHETTSIFAEVLVDREIW